LTSQGAGNLNLSVNDAYSPEFLLAARLARNVLLGSLACRGQCALQILLRERKLSWSAEILTFVVNWLLRAAKLPCDPICGILTALFCFSYGLWWYSSRFASIAAPRRDAKACFTSLNAWHPIACYPLVRLGATEHKCSTASTKPTYCAQR
jgi:hypothetical protein